MDRFLWLAWFLFVRGRASHKVGDFETTVNVQVDCPLELFFIRSRCLEFAVTGALRSQFWHLFTICLFVPPPIYPFCLAVQETATFSVLLFSS